MTYPPYPSYSDPSEGGSQPLPPFETSAAVALQPVRPLAIAAASIAIVVTLLQIAEAVAAFSARQTYLDAAARGQSAYDVFTVYDAMAIPWLGAMIVAYVLGCLWLHRARTNSEIINPEVHHARSPGWSWGGWVVPIVSLWFPFQVVRDVRHASNPPRTPRGPLIGWWWAFWLIGLGSTQIGTDMIGDEKINIGGVKALGTVETIDAALTVIGLVLWLQIIRSISRHQEAAITARR